MSDIRKASAAECFDALRDRFELSPDSFTQYGGVVLGALVDGHQEDGEPPISLYTDLHEPDDPETSTPQLHARLDMQYLEGRVGALISGVRLHPQGLDLVLGASLLQPGLLRPGPDLQVVGGASRTNRLRRPNTGTTAFLAAVSPQEGFGIYPTNFTGRNIKVGDRLGNEADARRMLGAAVELTSNRPRMRKSNLWTLPTFLVPPHRPDPLA